MQIQPYVFFEGRCEGVLEQKRVPDSRVDTEALPRLGQG